MRTWQKWVLWCSGAFGMMAFRDLLSCQNIWLLIDGAISFGLYKLAHVKVTE